MKALTLFQPYATLVAVGAKKIETRSWYASYRGPLAIHSSRSFPRWAREFARADGYCAAILEELELTWDTLPLGAVLAVCTLKRCVPTENIQPYISAQEFALGDYTEGRWAWELSGTNRLIKPIGALGARGLWEWDPGPDMEAALGIGKAVAAR